MTSASDTAITSHAGPGTAPLRAKWGWIVALGVVYLIAGLIALGSVVAATVASVLVVGVMMIIAGVAEVFNAFQVKSWGKFLLWALLGVLYVVAGFVTFENPLLAAAVLTLLLGATLVASGIMRIVLAFGMKQETPWIWVVLSGVITLLLGLVDSGALARLKFVYPRGVPRHRSHHGRRGLDRARLWTAKPRPRMIIAPIVARGSDDRMVERRGVLTRGARACAGSVSPPLFCSPPRR